MQPGQAPTYLVSIALSAFLFLRHYNYVTWLQLYVVFRMFAVQNRFVIKWMFYLLSALCAKYVNALCLGELREPSRTRKCLERRHVGQQGLCARAHHLASHVYAPTVDLCD